MSSKSLTKVQAVMNLGLGHATAEAPSIPQGILSDQPTPASVPDGSIRSIPGITITVPFNANGGELYLTVQQAKHVYGQLKYLFD